MSNLDLWNRVSKIDPKFTKQATVNGQRINSFSLQSVLLMATDEFGKFGKGWGYEVETERFDEGAVIQEAVTHENGDKQPEIKEVTHTLLIRFWYVDEGEKITCPIQAGHTPYLRKTKYGPSHDGEYYKKTLADAIKKSLSMLGFAADIFLGLTDDAHYQQTIESERQLKASSELPEKIEEFGNDVMRRCELFKGTSMAHSITAMFKSTNQTIHSQCEKLNIKPDVYLAKVEEAYKARIEEIRNASKIEEGK